MVRQWLELGDGGTLAMEHYVDGLSTMTVPREDNSEAPLADERNPAGAVKK